MGDLMCRCQRKKSQHEGGTGRCSDPAARCHEFVLALPPDPLQVSDQMVNTAVVALKAAIASFPGDLSLEEMARAVLYSGNAVAMVRDWELKAVRRSRDAYREQVAWMTAQLNRMGVRLDEPDQQV